jgi:DNA primase
MNSPVEEIKSKLNIVNLIGAYVRLQKMGAHFKAPCPFHNEKTPSFMVNEERQMWHCFGCNKGGDAFAFLMEIENIDFREALKILAERTGVVLPKQGKFEEIGAKNRSFEILELATKFYEKQLWGGVGEKLALPYLLQRGLSEASIRNFRLGFAPNGWRNITDFLIKRGFLLDEIEKTGLLIRKETSEQNTVQTNGYDRFRDRIMFPIMDILGRVIGYSARVSPQGDESQAKYINTPETSLYHKSFVLYGIQRAKQSMKQMNSVLLVEGNIDVIASHQAGLTNAVAVSGTALTEEQLALMKRYTENILLFFDMDSAGQKAARRSTEIALEKGFTVSLVSTDQGKDAADIARDNPVQLMSAVKNALPALQYFLEKYLRDGDASTPEGKRAIATQYVELVQFSAFNIDRAFWMKRLAQALEVEENSVFTMLKNILNEKYFSSKKTFVPVANTNPTQMPKEQLEKRSEFLRRQIGSVMILESSVWQSLHTLCSSEVAAFLHQDSLLSFLFDNEKSGEYVLERVIGFVADQSVRQHLTQLYFEGERILEGNHFTNNEDKKAYIQEQLTRYLAELSKALRNEKKVHLERAMKEARERGDKSAEQKLWQEFSTLLKG